MDRFEENIIVAMAGRGARITQDRNREMEEARS